MNGGHLFAKTFHVIPAKARIHFPAIAKADWWIPAFAGMTSMEGWES